MRRSRCRFATPLLLLAAVTTTASPAPGASDPRPVWLRGAGVHLSAPLERMLRDQYRTGVPLPPAAVRKWRLDAPDPDPALAAEPAVPRPEPFRAEHTAVVGLAPDAMLNDRSGDTSCSACGYRPLGQAETTIAAMGGNLLAGWNDARGFCVSTVGVQAYAWSTNGGASWTDAGDPPLLPSGARWRGDPVHGVNRRTGSFYIAGLCEGGSLGSGLFLARGHFSGPGFVLDDNRQIASGGSNFLDKPWLAVDSLSGHLYVTYSNFVDGVNSQIELIRSADNGVSWSAPQVLSAASEYGNVQGSRPVVGPGGELYVVWYEYGYPKSHLHVRRSNDLGASFGAEVTVVDYFENGLSGAPGFRRPFAPTFPSAAIDMSGGSHRGRLYVAWDEAVDFYDAPFPTSPTTVTETENDGFFGSAVPFTVGNRLRGAVDSGADLDLWRFYGTHGQTLVVAADSAAAGSSIDLRLVCMGDTSTVNSYRFLAWNQGMLPSIAFTLPSDALYVLRINPTAGDPTYGGYRLLTTWDTPTAGERARDHRDRFVTHSDDGTAWSAPVRLNDDAPWFDGIFPELTVDGTGAVHAFWHDFRDDPGCGALSYEYLASSGDGGVTWGPNRRMSDVQSFWSLNACGSANQGDYQGITSEGWTVDPAWADSRAGDPDAYAESATLRHDAACPAPAAANDSSDTAVTVSVQNPGNTDALLAVAITDPQGWITGIVPPPSGSTAIPAGGSQSYIVHLHVPGHCQPAADDTVTLTAADLYVPGRTRVCRAAVHCNLVTAVAGGSPRPLAFAPPRPNPSAGGARFTFALPRAGHVTLRLFAANGARLRTVMDGPLAAGSHELAWDGRDERGRRLAAGVYWARLEAGGRRLERPLVVVR